jgi:hypothetical protein
MMNQLRNKFWIEQKNLIFQICNSQEKASRNLSIQNGDPTTIVIERSTISTYKSEKPILIILLIWSLRYCTLAKILCLFLNFAPYLSSKSPKAFTSLNSKSSSIGIAYRKTSTLFMRSQVKKTSLPASIWKLKEKKNCHHNK